MDFVENSLAKMQLLLNIPWLLEAGDQLDAIVLDFHRICAVAIIEYMEDFLNGKSQRGSNIGRLLYRAIACDFRNAPGNSVVSVTLLVLYKQFARSGILLLSI